MQQFGQHNRPRPQVSIHATVPVPAHAGAGAMVLPAVEQQVAPRERASILTADVLGGIAFSMLVGILVINLSAYVLQGSGWAGAIGQESIWVFVAMAAATMLRSGVDHVITWHTTLEGLRLDWPEIAFATWVMYEALQYGMPHGLLGPLGFALSVGAAEEMVFRVMLLGWLLTKLDTPRAVLVSAVVFGLVHLHEISLIGMMSVVPQFAGGIVLGAVYVRTRNPIGPILVHAYWDLPYFLALGNGISGGGTAAGMPSPLSILMWMAFGAYGLYLVRPGQDVAGRSQPLEPSRA